MAILVIEDDLKTGDYLKKGLLESGYSVDLARNGIDGLHRLREQRYDVLVLDVMLPGKDGWQVIEEVRQDSDVPVIFLTARDHVADRIRGLRLGADDYLVKPFAFSELLARVHALQRRGRSQESTLLRLADLELDLASRKAQRGGRRLDLTAKEFSLLALLLRRQGQILSRTTLAEQVWDMNFDSDTNVIDVAIRRLRGKLDDPYDAKLLHTVRGMGYVLESRPS